MKFNIINLILILVISIFACNAQITKKVSSRSTIPQGYFSTHISVNYGTADLVLPNTVADVSMACYPPKGLRKREYTDTTKSSQKTKVIPHLNTTTTRTTKVIPNLSTITTKTIKTPPTKTTRSLYPWEQYAEQIRNQPTIQGDYTLYSSFGGMTLCKIYTKPYPTVTKIYFSKEIKTFTTYTKKRSYKGISNGITTSLYRTETPYIGYTTAYTYLPVTVTMTSRDQDFSHIYSIDCKSGTRVNTKIPYISTVTYSEPTEVSTITEGRIGKTTTLTFLDVKTDYIKNYSSGTITYSNCSLKKNAKTLPIITTTTTTKIVPNVTTTTTTTTTTKRLPISTTTTTTTTKRLPITTTTTTTTTKRLPISTTTTTTTTKRLPISTTTITTTTKRLPISECEPVTITVTDKDKVTVTEKETVTVTVGSDDSVQCVKKWGKCGGVGYNGPTCCESGSTCKKLSEYYSQCI